MFDLIRVHCSILSKRNVSHACTYSVPHCSSKDHCSCIHQSCCNWLAIMYPSSSGSSHFQFSEDQGVRAGLKSVAIYTKSSLFLIADDSIE